MSNPTELKGVPVRPWIFRALINAIQVGVLGVLAGALFPLALALLGIVSLPGRPAASPKDAAGFLEALYSGHLDRVIVIAAVAGLIGFVVGIGSTPVLGNHRRKFDEYKVVWSSGVASAFLLGLLSSLLGLTSYWEGVIVLGLFIGLPATVVLGSTFYTKAEKGFDESGRCHSVLYLVVSKYLLR
ncbi:MAG: hypothetical protein EPO21_06240 [Chloroflexota bacterium]|nr:MAG: hypothetical protein EPO21_06240 [Chloroflexota bacterium]